MLGPELGEFLRSRRERLDPTSVGFPRTPRRRTTGLRREELASLAGIAVSWLAKLEQGRAHGVSPDVLSALADALRLDAAERVHLFSLAGLRATDGPGASSSVVGPPLLTLLESLEPNPAYVLDRDWTILAHNRAEARLFPPIVTPVPPNLLELVFGHPELAALMADHDEELVRLVAQFRAHATQWPGSEVDALVDRLRRSSPAFERLWSDRDVAPFETTLRVFDHPIAGRLEFDHHRFAVLDRPGAQLVVYTSAAGSDSAERLLAAAADGPRR